MSRLEKGEGGASAIRDPRSHLNVRMPRGDGFGLNENLLDRVRAPVRRLRELSEILSETEGPSSTSRRVIDCVRTEAASLEDILVAFSRLSELRREPSKWKILRPREICYGLWEELAPGEDASLDVGIDDPIFAHPVHFASLVQELMSNAIRFRNESPLVVEISSKSSGPRQELRVDDNGQGIPVGMERCALELFSTCHPASGAGVGLALADRIARFHAWQLVLGQSDLGGARIRVVQK